MQTRVFVIKPSSFGDIIHTLPAAVWIKQVHPDWQLSWLVNTEWAALLAENPTVSETILFPRRAFRGMAGLGRFASWVRTEMWPRRPDIAVDFQGLLRSALLGRFSRARVLHGLSDAREGAGLLYTRTAAIPKGTPHAVERYMALASQLAGVGADAKSGLSFPLPAGILPDGAHELENKTYVLLHPFSRGAGKSLTPDQVRIICGRLAPEKRVVIAGRCSHGEEIALLPNCVSYLDRTDLPGLIWLVRHAASVISVDSGPMHLAAALGRPLVAIHTWSDPRKVGPYRADAWVWKNGRLFQFAERHTLGENFYRLRPRPLQCSDLEAISDLASGNAETPTLV